MESQTIGYALNALSTSSRPSARLFFARRFCNSFYGYLVGIPFSDSFRKSLRTSWRLRLKLLLSFPRGYARKHWYTSRNWMMDRLAPSTRTRFLSCCPHIYLMIFSTKALSNNGDISPLNAARGEESFPRSDFIFWCFILLCACNVMLISVG